MITRILICLALIFCGVLPAQARQELVKPVAATSATFVSGDYLTENGNGGLTVIVPFTAVSGAGTWVITVDAKAPDGSYYTILTSAAVSTTQTVILRIARGLTAVANLTANDAVPPVFRVSATLTGTSTMNIGIGVNFGY